MRIPDLLSFTVARSLDESATLEGTASQANLEKSNPLGQIKMVSLFLFFVHPIFSASLLV